MLDRLPAEILALVAAKLHIQDIVALELVNKCIRNTLLKHFWNGVPELVYYSVERPLNPLSMAHFPLLATTKFPPSQQQHFLALALQRCGPKLRALSLDCWTWLTRWGGTLTYKTMPFHSGAACSELISAHCQSLRRLNLCHMPLSGQALVTIAESIGHTLEDVVLHECFQRPEYLFPEPPVENLKLPKSSDYLERDEWTPSAQQFHVFCARLTHLRELDISFNELDQTLSFSAISTHLRSFSALEAYLTVAQFAELTRRTAGTLRCLKFTIERRSKKDAETLAAIESQLDQLFEPLKMLEELWIGKLVMWRLRGVQLRLPLTVCRSLRCLRLKNASDEDNFCESLGQMAHNLVNLQQLHVQSQCNGNFMHVGILTKLHTLSLVLCPKVNDRELALIAPRLGCLQELRIVYCVNVSWIGLAAFLQHCKHLCRLEGFDQLNDELLDQVFATMDNRYATAAKPNGQFDQRLFRFIRFRIESLSWLSSSPATKDGVSCVVRRVPSKHSARTCTPGCHTGTLSSGTRPKPPAAIYGWIHWGNIKRQRNVTFSPKFNL